MKINDFVSCKEHLPKFGVKDQLRGGWVLGKVKGSLTNIKTVRYIEGYNRWQNRDYSWCEEEITHWCHLEEDEKNEEDKFFGNSEEYCLVPKEDMINICETAIALTLLKFLGVLVTTGNNPTRHEMETIRNFSNEISKEMVDKLFNEFKNKKKFQEHTITPAAYLFANGNAAYFDEKGKQIPTLQTHGWLSIHEFIKLFPKAPISVQQADPLPLDLVERFIKNIKQIEELPY